MSRPNEVRETIAAARRFLRAAGKRVATEGDEPELAELVALHAELEAAIRAGVAGQRARGRSWAFVGAALGITRQSAQERYGERRDLAA